MKSKVYVDSIKDTKNPLVKQLMLRSESEKSAEANPVAFFMQGLPNVVPNIEKRVAWQSVSTDFIAQFGIQPGDDFGAKIGKPDICLVVKESTIPRTWMNADGTVGISQPKINPQTKEQLTLNGAVIYRNTYLSLDGKTLVIDQRNPPVGINLDAKDELVQHTNVSSGQRNTIAAIIEAGKRNTTVGEPTLPGEKV